MSKIQDLIDELCPDGVEFKALGEIAEYSTRKIASSDINDEQFIGVENLKPNFSGFVSGTKPEKESSLNLFREGDILLGNIRPYLKKMIKADFLGGASPDVLVISIVEDFRAHLDSRYLYWVLSSSDFVTYNSNNARGGKMPRGDKKMILKYRVPVPPLKVQEEIVRILDSFTLLEAELEAELEARRKQYAHYRDSLLFSDKIKYNYLNLSEVGVISTGKTPSKLESSAWSEGINFVTPSDIRNGQKYISSSERTVDKEWVFNKNWKVVKDNSILVTCIGADMGKAVIPTQESVFNQQINSIEVSDNVDIEYLYYWLVSRREYMLRLGRKNGSTMPILNKTNFSKIVVNLPELWLQRKISKQISVFDALVNDISSGLPAEIAARRKQYEYYRNQLLTFKELEPASA